MSDTYLIIDYWQNVDLTWDASVKSTPISVQDADSLEEARVLVKMLAKEEYGKAVKIAIEQINYV